MSFAELNETEQLEFKDHVKAILIAGPTLVTFTKVDGTIREMNCTLRADLLPPPEPVIEPEEGAEPVEPKKERKVNPNVQTAFDLDKKEWRSFKYDTIISIESTLGV